ncbi:hypothetical protein HPB48_008900 [Haemaphysalis longicornis]|uniref:Cytochrome P450 n=1 Tax=Haemaphysalis longicornis TaxID=44386 RepID=A0A9J6FT09_HAELO|nr:hypothetical protein HPB48_008900 [Haemaphysalis longicornis]
MQHTPFGYLPLRRFTTRCAEEDYQCGSYLIKKGTSVMVPLYQLHHDPLLWVDPEKFDPDRQVVFVLYFETLGGQRRL